MTKEFPAAFLYALSPPPLSLSLTLSLTYFLNSFSLLLSQSLCLSFSRSVCTVPQLEVITRHHTFFFPLVFSQALIE